jgi:hypothetical protein
MRASMSLDLESAARWSCHGSPELSSIPPRCAIFWRSTSTESQPEELDLRAEAAGRKDDSTRSVSRTDVLNKGDLSFELNFGVALAGSR